MKKKSTTTIFKITALVMFISFMVGCKKDAIPPADAQYDLNVFLDGQGKFQFSGSGFIAFRQNPDTARIVDLNTSVHNLEPNHSYLLQRAVNPIADATCSSTAWLTLGLGLTPQSIHTDGGG